MEVNLDSEDEHSEGSELEELADPIETDGSDGEGQPFDITLAATHSYMGSDLEEIAGRNILEAGWEGLVPAMPHHSCVFPGETVPMLINNSHDAALVAEAIQKDKLFGLLFPDESGSAISGYGVVCSVFEAGVGAGAVTFKARAAHRVRLREPAGAGAGAGAGGGAGARGGVRRYRVAVLPERTAAAPLRHARLASLDSLRSASHSAIVRVLDAAVTPWPGFVYEIFDYKRMRNIIKDYFRTLDLDHLLPTEAVSLSFWVASNLTLSARDRLALFLVDDALQRLHMECAFIARKSVLCCSSCMCEIARREHVFAMSTDGVHANYTNLSGFMHDVVTVTTATNTVASGSASAEYSWFPGYAWRVALCGGCSQHVGWRFTALRRHLKPHAFYSLCRNYVTPRDTTDDVYDQEI